MSSKVRCISVGLLQTNCYIVDSTAGDGSRFIAVVDPGDMADRIISALEEDPTHIILTHCHFDHIGALKELLEKYPMAKFAMGADEKLDPKQIAEIAAGVLGSFFFSRGYDRRIEGIRKPDILLKDRDPIGPFMTLHTPGHTEGSICLYDRESGILLSGDTLFLHSYGRTDLGGSEADMEKSLRRILSLDPETKVYPGHGETTTIGDERDCFMF